MADEHQFAVSVVAPERVLYDGVASEVMLRTAEGDITFLAGHTPLVGAVEPGVVRVVGDEGDVRRFAIHGGFVQVEHHPEVDPANSGQANSGQASTSASGGGRVTILAGIAEPSTEIDVARAQAALESAEARVAELQASSARGSGATGGATGAEGGSPVDPEETEAQAAVLRARVRLEAADATAPAGS